MSVALSKVNEDTVNVLFRVNRSIEGEEKRNA